MTVRKLLVANRGEIAVRVFRTCRELGIATVAVAAPDDAGAHHARTADETVAVAAYLHSEEHVRAALESSADAIHPGYGFLAENADFAEAVMAAGLTWIGPPPEALRLGGDKLAAKRIATEAGVPVVPTGEPDALGYPLLVKAAAGGGGRGMRVVRVPEELEEALAAAARDPDLVRDEIAAGHELGDGVLDLNPAVQLEEPELAAVEHELGCARPGVADRGRERYGGRAHLRPKLRVECRGRGLLEHLLVAPLDGTVAFAEREHRAVFVGEDLDLDVAGPTDVALAEDGAVTSRSRSSPTPTAPRSRSASATARCSGATKRCSRSPPPRRSTRNCGQR